MYHDSHMSIRAIEKITGVPKSTVFRWVHESTSCRTGKTRTGRPTKLSKRDIRHLIFMIRHGHAGRKLSYVQLALESGLNVSGMTVKRALNQIGYHRCKACRKPYISPSAQQKRIRFIQEHLHWSINDWSHIV